VPLSRESIFTRLDLSLEPDQAEAVDFGNGRLQSVDDIRFTLARAGNAGNLLPRRVMSGNPLMEPVVLFAIPGQYCDKTTEICSNRTGALAGRFAYGCMMRVFAWDQHSFFPLAGGGAILLSSGHGGCD
jgi:hypothetical protein